MRDAAGRHIPIASVSTGLSNLGNNVPSRGFSHPWVPWRCWGEGTRVPRPRSEANPAPCGGDHAPGQGLELRCSSLCSAGHSMMRRRPGWGWWNAPNTSCSSPSASSTRRKVSGGGWRGLQGGSSCGKAAAPQPQDLLWSCSRARIVCRVMSRVGGEVSGRGAPQSGARPSCGGALAWPGGGGLKKLPRGDF